MDTSTKSPVGGVAPGFFGNLKCDATAGLLVSLTALPLCLAVAHASRFPAIAGVWTAVIGGILTSLVSNSQLTVKGPAVGLIVAVTGAVTGLGEEFGKTLGLPESEWPALGYRLTLGLGVTAGVIQILFALLRAGRLVDLFPLTPVHGLIAGIGVIIIARQAYQVVGVPPTPGAGPLTLAAEFAQKLPGLNSQTALVGGVGLGILFGLFLLTRSVPAAKKLPGPLLVLLAGVGLGAYSEFGHADSGPAFLAAMPNVLAEPGKAFALPDFRGLATATGLTYLLLFTLVGSLESLFCAKAVELLDPWRRKTNFDRDLLTIGLANAVAASVGALPMVAEIVRSRANIDAGARSRAANLVHGLCLLAFVLVGPHLVPRVPLAALAAVLVFAGFRLASPREFGRTYRVGGGQFVIFAGTVVAALATDLLTGLAIGVGLEVVFRLWHGAPVTGLLKSDIGVVPEGDDVILLVVRRAAVFGDWPGLRHAIVTQAAGRQDVVVDMSQTRPVDYTAIEKLRELQAELEATGKRLKLIGLDEPSPPPKPPVALRRMSSVA